MSRALQINSSPQGWMARNTKPVPLAEKGWVITMKKISIILLSAVLVFSMAACNGGKEKADNQTEKQTESVKPTEEAEMATEAVTEVTTEAGSEAQRKILPRLKIQERRLIRKITSLLIMKLLQSRKKSQSRMTSRNRKLLQVVIRKLVEIRVMQVMVVRLQTVRKTM